MLELPENPAHKNPHHEIVDRRRPQGGLYYVIPAFVMENPELECSEIVFYALLSGLAYNSGYCTASDEYLAERMKSHERSVRKWLLKLERQKLIKRETTKNGMYWSRKIYILMDNSNKVYEGNSTATSNGPTNGTPIPDRAEPQYRKVSKENIESNNSSSSGSKTPYATVSPSDLRRRMLSKGWKEKEFDEAWSRYILQPPGSIKAPSNWLESVMESIRIQDSAENQAAERAEEKARTEKAEQDAAKKRQDLALANRKKNAPLNKAHAAQYAGKPWIRFTETGIVLVYSDASFGKCTMAYDEEGFQETLKNFMNFEKTHG